MNYGLVNQQYKSTVKLLLQIAIFNLKRKSFPRRCFPIYGIIKLYTNTVVLYNITIATSNIVIYNNQYICICSYSDR